MTIALMVPNLALASFGHKKAVLVARTADCRLGSVELISNNDGSRILASRRPQSDNVL